jgi:hypothetical protein
MSLACLAAGAVITGAMATAQIAGAQSAAQPPPQGRGGRGVDPAVAARIATAPPLTIEQVNKWETELSNWGK